MTTQFSNDKLLIRIGKRLKEAREAKGMSQQEFADICEVEKSTISRIERGVVNSSIITLAHIAEHLDLELWEFLRFKS